jgi:hypothetical protein
MTKPKTVKKNSQSSLADDILGMNPVQKTPFIEKQVERLETIPVEIIKDEEVKLEKKEEAIKPVKVQKEVVIPTIPVEKPIEQPVEKEEKVIDNQGSKFPNDVSLDIPLVPLTLAEYRARLVMFKEDYVVVDFKMLLSKNKLENPKSCYNELKRVGFSGELVRHGVTLE